MAVALHIARAYRQAAMLTGEIYWCSILSMSSAATGSNREP